MYMIKRIRLNKKKGFTLIELIVVMAVVGILVLLAVPKFLSKTEQAKMAQIQNDIRVVEGKLNEVLVGKPDTLKTWEPAEASELTELVSENKLMGRGGPALDPPTGDVWVIDEAFLDTEVRTKLTGDFFVDADGNVFYEHSKPVVPGEPETPPEKEETPLTYEEWLAKVQAEGYVLATDADFSGETDGTFKYTGKDKLVIVPNVIKGVDVTSYNKMFEGTRAEGVASYNPNITDMSRMFSNSYTPTLDVSRLNTTGVMDMSYMFLDSQTTTLDLSNFNTANVTTMRSMFWNSQATALDLSSFDTANVTTMRSMFNNSAATNVNLNSFNTANVTNMRTMFQLSKATTLDLSSFDTSKVTDMSYMFSTSQATTLDLSSFNTANVMDMSYMFPEIQATTLDLSSFNTAKVTNMNGMFQDSQATTGIARTTNDANRFNSSSNKPSGLAFIVNEQPVNYVLATDEDFMGDANGTFRYNGTNHYVIMPDTIKGVKVTSYKNMFEESDVRGVISDNPNITDMSRMFYYSYAPTLDVSRLDTTGVTDMSRMFLSSQATTLDLSSFNTANVTTMRSMFYDSQATTLDLSSFDTANVAEMYAMFYKVKATNLNLNNFNTANVTDMHAMFRYTQATTLDLSSFDTSNVTDMAYMFYVSQATTGIARTMNDANRFNSSSDKPDGLTFIVREQPVNYVLATDADFTGDANGAFHYNGANHYVIIPDTINGVKVTSYKSMFENSDVRGVVSDNPNITDMSRMFSNSYAPTLDVSRLNTANVTNMQAMFNEAKATNLNLNNFNTANVTNMGFMFNNSAATNVNLNSFNTANVTNMRAMFQFSKAKTLDLSSFDTSKVTDMSYMFNEAEATNLNLNNFNTANVTDMNAMFQSSKATTLDLSSFDTSKVTDLSYMFNHTKATTGYARNTDELSRFNRYTTRKPDTLTFTVK